MKITEEEIELEVRSYVRRFDCADIHNRISKTAAMFARRVNRAPSSAREAVAWAADRVIAEEGHYDHGTGAVR